MRKMSKAQVRKRLEESAVKLDKAMRSQHISPTLRTELFKMMNRLIVISTKMK